jgi:hypothetical protein
MDFIVPDIGLEPVSPLLAEARVGSSAFKHQSPGLLRILWPCLLSPTIEK